MLAFGRYADRADAGRYLARKLGAYANRSDVIVLALPRGGVEVGAEIAWALHVALDVLLVRKLGVPGHEELAMGAIAADVIVLNAETMRIAGVSEEDCAAVVARERAEMERRESLYRGDRGPLNVEGRIAIVVDDGLATGSTMQAAIRALRAMQPRRIIVAVPVGAVEACAAIAREADEVICGRTPQPFYAVGSAYERFGQLTDEDVRRLLDAAR